MSHSNRPRPSAPPNLAGTGDLFGEIQFTARDVSRDVLLDVVELAIEIAREGREGRKIGTLFTVGDHARVLERSRCLILDPLAGHADSARSISSPNMRETVKELAQLDGGFVVDAAGIVVSAARFFETSLPANELTLGLGTRHIAAASITRCTAALAVVVSESSVVRVFADGELIAEVLPELWLLHRHTSHIAHPSQTEHPAENLAVVASNEAHEPRKS